MVDGWLALGNRKLRQGLAFSFDHQATEGVYVAENCRIRGWLVDGGVLAPGKSFQYGFQVIPLKGLGEIYHVSPEYCAGIYNEDGRIRLEFLPSAPLKILGTATVATAAGATLAQKSFELDAEPGKPASFDIETVKPKTQTVIKVEANGQTFERYCENGFRLQEIPFCPLVTSYHRSPPERRQGSGENSPQASVARGKKALLLFGLYSNFNRFDQILAGWDIKTIPAVANGMRELPPASNIDQYALIIISDVNIESMRAVLPRLISYVKGGGVLLVTGGPFAYGCGGYDQSPLDPLLPVASKPFDLRPACGDQAYNQALPFKGAKIDPANAPEVYWLHKCALRQGAETLLEAGGLPLMAGRRHERGKVLCFLGSPLGQPGEGSKPYWDSPEYVNAMRSILTETMSEVKP